MLDYLQLVLFSFVTNTAQSSWISSAIVDFQLELVEGAEQWAGYYKSEKDGHIMALNGNSISFFKQTKAEKKSKPVDSSVNVMLALWGRQAMPPGAEMLGTRTLPLQGLWILNMISFFFQSKKKISSFVTWKRGGKKGWLWVSGRLVGTPNLARKPWCVTIIFLMYQPNQT